MPWAAAISAVGTVAGAAIGASGKSSGQSSTSTNTPWSEQAQYLGHGMGLAEQIFNARGANPYYAPQNATQTAANNQLFQDADQFGRPGYQKLFGAGTDNLGALGSYRMAAEGNAAHGIGSADPNLSNVLTGYATSGNLPGQGWVDPNPKYAVNNFAVTGGLQGRDAIDPEVAARNAAFAKWGVMDGRQQIDPNVAGAVANSSMGSLGSLSQGQQLALQAGNTGLNTAGAASQTAANAGQFVNNGVLQGQIDALGTDIGRNLNETTLPGIRQAAAASGNVNSSREGALEAIAGRGAQENLVNAAAQLRGTAYNKGLDVANSQYGTGLGAAVGSAQSLNNNGSVGMTGANAWQGLQQQQDQFNTSSRLNAGNTWQTLAQAQDQFNTGLRVNAGNAWQGLDQQQRQFDTSSRLNAANQQQTQNAAWGSADAAARTNANAQVGNAGGMAAAYLGGGTSGVDGQDQLMFNSGNWQQQQDQSAMSANDQRLQGLLNDYWNVVSRGYNGANTNTSNSTNTSGGGLSGALQGGIGGALSGFGVANNATGGQLGSSLQNSVWNAFNDVPGNTGSPGGTGTQFLQDFGLYKPLT